MAEESLLELYFHFILIWIMVDLWVVFINNFAYRTIGMNEDSSYDSLIVALFITSCSLVIIGSGLSFISGSSDTPQVNLPDIEINNANYNPINQESSIQLNNIKLAEAKKIQPNIVNIKQPKDIKLQDLSEYFVSVKSKKTRKNRMRPHDQLFKLNIN